MGLVEKKKTIRLTKWIDTNIEYILVNNLTEHESYSDFVRSALAKEIRRLLEANNKHYKTFMHEKHNS